MIRDSDYTTRGEILVGQDLDLSPTSTGVVMVSETLKRLAGIVKLTRPVESVPIFDTDLEFGECSTRGCWRMADLPGGTCYHHGPHANLPTSRILVEVPDD
jgi:hypothetical protein